MPIYDYACEKCGNEFEVEQRITDDPVKSCPSCRSRRVKRLISQTSFVLKGGGWYSDLYSSARGKAEKSDGTGDDGGSGAGGAKKSDSGKSDSASDGAKSGGSDAGKASGKGAKAAA